MQHKTERRIVELHTSLLREFRRDRKGQPEKRVSTPKDEVLWLRVRANKMNQRTAAQIQRVADTAGEEHQKILRTALQRWAEKVNLTGISDLCTGEALYHLAYNSSDYSCRHDRTIVCDIARAILRGKTPEQCRRLFQSRSAYYFDDKPRETPSSTSVAKPDESSGKLEELRKRLESTELLPENEAVRFELETKIYQQEQELDDDEWPEVIGD